MMTLANELRSHGQHVEFATFKGRGLGAHVESEGFLKLDFRVRTKVDPLAIARMARHIRRRKIDIVHGHLSTSVVNGCLAARLAKVPSIATVHGMSGRLSFLPAHHLIAVSSEVRKHLIDQGVHESKISIVPNGIHFPTSDPLARSRARASLGLDESVPVLGTTARLTALKGMDHALYAFSRVVADIPDAHYIVMGDGDETQTLVDLAKSLGIQDRVRWLGYRPDVAELLPALDVFVFPSLREAMGIAVVEAMAAGVPSVASRIGGIPEVLADESGILVPPADPVAMSDAILELLRDSERRVAMGMAAQTRARTEYSAQRMAARTIGVYTATLARFHRV